MKQVVLVLLCLIWVVSCKTIVSIQETQFYINNVVTNANSQAAGLLINSKMTQAIFDDENPSTVGNWNYPDTHQWNATRNTLEFIGNVSTYNSWGLNAVTVGMQGSNPGKSNQQCIVTGYTATGTLKPAWVTRLLEVIKATDQQGMVVILNLFDLNQEARLNSGDSTIVNAVQAVVQLLVQQGATNVILDLADACSPSYTHDILTPGSIGSLIRAVQSVSNIPVSTSFPPGVVPPDNIIQMADFVLLHATGLNSTGLNETISKIRSRPVYKKSPIPIVINQDSDVVAGDFAQAVLNGVSWGYFNQGNNNYKDGYCSPPVDWGIDTVAKKAFFSEVWLLTQ